MEFKRGHKKIGTLDKQKRVLRKEVNQNFHLFRKLNAWGIDYKMLEDLEDTTTILVHEYTQDKYYWLTKAEILVKGENFIGYHEHGLQRMVPLDQWHTLTPEQAEENEYLKHQGLPLKYLPV